MISPEDVRNGRGVLHQLATRPKEETAEVILTGKQTVVIVLILGIMAAAILKFGYMPVLLTLAGTITLIYVVIIVFKGLLTAKSLESALMVVTDAELRSLIQGSTLPRYTILVPLYDEHNIAAKLIDNLGKLDYPIDRLQIILLLEEKDRRTIREIESCELPSCFEILIMPESILKTKPRACNEGLKRATGEFVVIYDAEDRPEPDQLKKAVACFRKSSRRVVCIQAKLEYYNPYTNWITKFFSAEYATYFNLILPGLGKMGMPVPLGGTSNHFRTDTVVKLGGWDAYNVTEDIDMGIRIARRRLQVRLMDSVTWEEANSHLGNLIRQRSRWKKGGMVTFLVHTRNQIDLYRDLGFVNFLCFVVIVAVTPLVLLVNPIFWIMTLAYEATNATFIEQLYPLPIFYLGVLSIALGNVLFVLYVMMGCKIRGLYPNIKWMVLAPLYWGILSFATWKALLQLITRPHFWEKTRHGLVKEVEPFGLESARSSAVSRTAN